MNKIINKLVIIIFLLIILIIFLFYVYFRYYSIGIKVFETNDNSAKHPVLVSTDFGSFTGTVVKYQTKEVLVFLGIPYALPPIDSLRFKKPVPMPQTKTIFEATHWPNPCLQKDNHLRLNNYNFSEDCLYLNIWTPSPTPTPSAAISFNSTDAQQKPVLVHIHTGAFMFGSASEVTYNGIVLSALGDVVVVTFNYRLNLYGFLYTGSDEVSVNAGMYDQVMALEWVNQNIHHFGGDPNRVTLLGQSTGSVSVGLHILSPISHKLFNSAVMLSGSPLQHYWLSEPEIAKQFWIKYSKEVKCLSEEQNVIKDRELQCLAQLSRNRLPSMSDTKRYSVDRFVVSAPVVFDEQFKPRNSIRSSRISNISLLFGYTDDEGSWMLALEDSKKFGPKVVQNMTSNEAMAELNQLIEYIKPNTKQVITGTNVSKYYFNSISKLKKTDKELMSRTIGIALGDFYISCPSHHLADYLFKNSNKSNIYQYYWTYKGDPISSSFWRTFEDVWCGKWMGSCHSFELYSIFGIPFQQSIAFNDIDRNISMKMIEIISDFAYYNKPMPAVSGEWLAFKAMDGYVVKPYHVIDYGLNLNQMFGQNLKKSECDSLWKPYIVD